jgi:serine protease
MCRSHWLLLILSYIALLFSGCGGAPEDDGSYTSFNLNTFDPNSVNFPFDEVLIKLRDDITEQEEQEFYRRHGMFDIDKIPYEKIKKANKKKRKPGKDKPPKMRRVKIPKVKNKQQMWRLLEGLSQDYAVEVAEPNFLIAAEGTPPNDPYFYRQWNLHGEGKGVNVSDAWEITSGNSDVIIAVIDTGVAYEDYTDPATGITYKKAPDLANTTFVPGYDFVNGDQHANDDHGHGTHVAGTIAQSTNNLEGVAGVAPGCTIMPIKVLNKYGYGYLWHLYNGIMYAKCRGAKVINLSLGTYFRSYFLEYILRRAYEAGIVVVCAAGNSGQDRLAYPAGYHQYCISVGGHAVDGRKTWYSSYGNALDISAPAGDTLFDLDADGYPDGILQQTIAWGDPTSFRYSSWMGTSMAAPHVSAIAALLISKGVTGAERVKEILLKSSRKKSSKRLWGAGCVDAAAALNYKIPSCDLKIVSFKYEHLLYRWYYFYYTAPPLARGDRTYLRVLVGNVGQSDVWGKVRVFDRTSGTEIGYQSSCYFPAGQSTWITMPWIVSGTTGQHVLEAVVEVAEDQDPTNNSKKRILKIVDPIYDVQVNCILRSNPVPENTYTRIYVLLRNTGNIQSYVKVRLTDMTTGSFLEQQLHLYMWGCLAVFDWYTGAAGTHTLEINAFPLDGEANLADNMAYITIRVGKPSTDDVRVKWLWGPHQIHQGHLGYNFVCLYNESNSPKTATVNVTDITTSTLLFSKTVTVEAQASCWKFFWYWTTDWALGTHILKAEIFVDGDPIIENNSWTFTLTIKPPMHEMVALWMFSSWIIDKEGSGWFFPLVFNWGSVTETVNITVRDLTDDVVLASEDVSIKPLWLGCLYFTWDTSGTTSLGQHEIRLEVSPVQNEVNPFNNTLCKTIEVQELDRAVKDISVPSTTIQVGTTVDVDVTVANNGSVPQTFNVRLTCTSSENYKTYTIGYTKVTLAAKTKQTITFPWDTTGLRAASSNEETEETDTKPGKRIGQDKKSLKSDGGNYTLKATVDAHWFESNRTNNSVTLSVKLVN